VKVELRAVQPEDAIAFFRQKGFAPPDARFDFRDVWRDQHARSFVVAKAMRQEVLETIRTKLDDALTGGKTLAQFTAGLEPELKRLGWWGQSMERDPLTGELKNVQLGSPRRLEVIFHANMRSAHAAGQWARIQRVKDAFPFLRYIQIQRRTKREEHARYHQIILPVDHPAWERIFPPNGWFCGCTVQQINQRMMDARGWKVTENFRLEERGVLNKRTGEVEPTALGVDPAWDGNPGRAWGGMEVSIPSTQPPTRGGYGRIDDANTFANAVVPAHGLPDVRASIDGEISEAAWNYQGSGYREVNQALRGEIRFNSAAEATRKGLDRAIDEAAPLPDGTTLYRGLFDVPALDTGQVLDDAAFASFSLSSRTASKFAVVGDEVRIAGDAVPRINAILRLRSDGGLRGIYLGDWEDEVILRRGVKIRVLSKQEVEFEFEFLPGETHRAVVYDVEVIGSEG